MSNVYEVCPIFQHTGITLRQTTLDDAAELLKCYSDPKAVPLFNSDNCHGDDFHYSSLERMRQGIEMWERSYHRRQFVRWTVILNSSEESIGTIEMFHRLANDEFNHYGILRIDLQSRFEHQSVIDPILEIVNDQFYQLFDVKSILTKAIPIATERVASLKKNGHSPLGKKLMVYDDYFIRTTDYKY